LQKKTFKFGLDCEGKTHFIKHFIQLIQLGIERMRPEDIHQDFQALRISGVPMPSPNQLRMIQNDYTILQTRFNTLQIGVAPHDLHTSPPQSQPSSPPQAFIQPSNNPSRNDRVIRPTTRVQLQPGVISKKKPEKVIETRGYVEEPILVSEIRNLRNEGSRKARRREQFNELFRSVKITSDDFVIGRTNRTRFSPLASDNKRSWFQFISADEEQQLEFLSRLQQNQDQKKRKGRSHRLLAEPQECMARMSHAARNLVLTTKVAPEFVHNVEEQLISFVRADSEYDFCDFEIPEPGKSHAADYDFCAAENPMQGKSEKKSRLLLQIDDAYIRLWTHALCQYYGLNSKSENWGEKRLTIITKRKTFVSFPSTRLLEHLAL